MLNSFLFKLSLLVLVLGATIDVATQTTKKPAAGDTWRPLGGIKEEFEEEGLSQDLRYPNFRGKIDSSFDFAWVKTEVDYLAKLADVSVDVLITTLPGHAAKAYRQASSGKDGTVVFELAFLKDILR